MGVALNAVIHFFKSVAAFFASRDGLVALAGIVLLAVVAHYNTENPWINLLARVGNLAIFLYILWRAAGVQVVAFLRDRRRGIAADFSELDARKNDAETELKLLRERIAGLDAECEAILSESRAQAELQRASLLAAAEKEAARIIENAERAAASDAKSAAVALRAQMAEDITAAVQAQLAARLTPADHARLIDNSLKRVVLN